MPTSAAHLLRMRCPAVLVDVGAVRRRGDRQHLDPEFLEDQRSNVICRSVRAVENRLDSFQTAVLNGTFCKFDIASSRIFDPIGLSDAAGSDFGDFAENDFFDFLFGFIGEFESVRAEDFDSVVIGGVVGGGDHDSAVRAHRPDQMCHRRGRHRTDFEDIHPHAEHSACESRFEHIAGNAGIFSDHGLCRPAVFCIDLSDSLPHFQGDFRSDRVFIRLSADSVRTK